MGRTVNDGLTIICEWAETAGTSLYALVGTRVGKQRIPTVSPPFTNTVAAIVVFPLAVIQDSFDTDVQDGRYAFRCYGGTANVDSASAVFRAVYDRFHKAHGDTTTGGIVLSEFEEGQPMIDPDEGWPLYVATFRIKTT